MQTAIKAEKPRKQAISGRFWAGRTYRGRIKDDHKIDPCMGSGHILVYLFEILMQIYKNEGYTERDATELILKNNIYGLDIDDRAYQLSYFAVMMKAREYNRNILKKDIKCHVHSIKESNLINRKQLSYFGSALSELEKNSAINQIEGLLDSYRDAKEYGSILYVEKYDWGLLRKFIESDNVEGQITFETIGIEHTRKMLEELINIGEVMSNRYEIVITNPPYMGSNNMDSSLLDYVTSHFKSGKTDLFAAFIEKCMQLTQINGMCSMITQQGWMFLSSYECIREDVLKKSIKNLLQLGTRAFDEISGEVVQTCTFVIQNAALENIKSTFVDLTDYAGEEAKKNAFLSSKGIFFANPSNFRSIPGTPFAYWASNRVLSIFSNSPKLSTLLTPRQGVKTLDNNRFLRLWFEVNFEKIGFGAESLDEANNMNLKWFPYNKGGTALKWYGNRDYIVNWENDGREMKQLAVEKYNSVTRTITNISYFFKGGITWSDVSTGKIAVRYSPIGSIFDSTGIMAFGDESELQYIIGLMNSDVMMLFMKILAPSLHFNGGAINNVPLIVDEVKKDEVVNLTKACEAITRSEWDEYEISWDYKKNPLVRLKTNDSVEEAFRRRKEENNDRINSIRQMENSLNKLFVDIYGLSDELNIEKMNSDVTLKEVDASTAVREFISYSVGCMFGRYSLDCDGLVNAGGPIEQSKYITYIPDQDAIIPITDEDYGFDDDIVSRFIVFVKKSFGEENLEQNLNFIAKALGNKGNGYKEILRNYFSNDFYKDHCNTYSVTGSGKRPIYWLFDSGKQNGFKALIYIHRYSPDTVGLIRSTYLHKVQAAIENSLQNAEYVISTSSSATEKAAASKKREKYVKQLNELRPYYQALSHVALQRIDMDLDDGVKANYQLFQGVEISTEGKKTQKIDLLAKI